MKIIWGVFISLILFSCSDKSDGTTIKKNKIEKLPENDSTKKLTQNIKKDNGYIYLTQDDLPVDTFAGLMTYIYEFPSSADTIYLRAFITRIDSTNDDFEPFSKELYKKVDYNNHNRFLAFPVGLYELKFIYRNKDTSILHEYFEEGIYHRLNIVMKK